MNETEQNKEMTQEEYKARVLKQNFAMRCSDYEDVIATLQTQIAMMEQQIKQLETPAQTLTEEVVTA
jgi:hypothetical protein